MKGAIAHARRWPHQNRKRDCAENHRAKCADDLPVAAGAAQTAEDELAQIRRDVQEEYENKADPYWATSELWDDGIIDPVDTRNVLGMAISAALNAPIEDDNLGLLRI